MRDTVCPELLSMFTTRGQHLIAQYWARIYSSKLKCQKRLVFEAFPGACVMVFGLEKLKKAVILISVYNNMEYNKDGLPDKVCRIYYFCVLFLIV